MNAKDINNDSLRAAWLKARADFGEDALVAAWDKASRDLSQKYSFGYHEADDIRQEVWIICLGKLDRFEPAAATGEALVRRLANFFFTTCRNALMNRKRDEYHRTDPPCKRCATGDYCRTGGCEEFVAWRDRNASKSALAQAGSGSDPGAGRKHFDGVPEDLLKLVEERLPQRLRSDWLRLLAGARFPKGRRQQLVEEVKVILSHLERDRG